MKKNGIINANLIGELTKLRHGDKFVICDVGLPIPENANIVDISLVKGIPSCLQTLGAVLNEVVVEEVVLQAPIQEYNEELDKKITSIFEKQKISYLDNDEFKDAVEDCKLFIRTAEYSPFANVLLYSASGVSFIQEELDIHVEIE